MQRYAAPERSASREITSTTESERRVEVEQGEPGSEGGCGECGRGARAWCPRFSQCEGQHHNDEWIGRIRPMQKSCMSEHGVEPAMVEEMQMADIAGKEIFRRCLRKGEEI